MFGPSRLEVVMSFRVTQSWPRRAVFAGALATVLLAFGVMPPPAAAQYVYDYGYIYTGPTYSYPPQSYPAYPSYPSYGQRYYGGGDWGSGRHWQDRTWNGEDWRRGDGRQSRGSDRRGRTNEDRNGSSSGGQSGGRQSSGAGGSGGTSNSWLGSHGSYR
jgi:hypothetical protein